jgi:hypothetical protein
VYEKSRVVNPDKKGQKDPQKLKYGHETIPVFLDKQIKKVNLKYSPDVWIGEKFYEDVKDSVLQVELTAAHKPIQIFLERSQ